MKSSFIYSKLHAGFFHFIKTFYHFTCCFYHLCHQVQIMLCFRTYIIEVSGCAGKLCAVLFFYCFQNFSHQPRLKIVLIKNLFISYCQSPVFADKSHLVCHRIKQPSHVGILSSACRHKKYSKLFQFSDQWENLFRKLLCPV